MQLAITSLIILFVIVVICMGFLREREIDRLTKINSEISYINEGLFTSNKKKRTELQSLKQMVDLYEMDIKSLKKKIKKDYDNYMYNKEKNIEHQEEIKEMISIMEDIYEAKNIKAVKEISDKYLLSKEV